MKTRNGIVVDAQSPGRSGYTSDEIDFKTFTMITDHRLTMSYFSRLQMEASTMMLKTMPLVVPSSLYGHLGIRLGGVMTHCGGLRSGLCYEQHLLFP